MKKGTVAVVFLVIVLLAAFAVPGCGGGDKGDSEKPKINTLDPGSGPRGTIVRIDGKSFGEAQNGSEVKVGNTMAEEILAWSDQSVAIRIPSNVNIAMQGISIRTGNGESNMVNFDVVKPDDGSDKDRKDAEIEHPTPSSAMPWWPP